MANSYTVDSLLSIIKKRAFIPINQETFTDQDLIDMMTDEMLDEIVPEMLATREEWYVTSEEFAAPPTGEGLIIPARAVGGALREVIYTQGNTEWDMPRLSLEDKVYKNNQGPVRGFYIENNFVYLMGSPSGKIKLYYHVRPNKLVKTTSAGSVVSIDTATNTMVLDTVPSSWSTTTKLDIIRKTPHFDHVALSLSISSIVGTTVTFSEPLAKEDNNNVKSDIASGMWVVEEDCSPVPQIPVEWFPYLAQAVVSQVLESVGDMEAAAKSEKRTTQLKRQALRVLTPRVKGEGKKIVPYKNRHGYFNPGWWNK